ncbi:MAG: Glu/Leu/Phe/Val dehydrogenase dimerization domain-containing protein, partial [Candidatus Acidiferrales bacterium]
MTELKNIQVEGYERVIRFRNDSNGLRGFLALHDTSAGPACGGIRLWPYASEEAALADALRLSRAMTYKAVTAELPCGGGKAVVERHNGMRRREAFESFGEFVDSLRGKFLTGPDAGVTEADLAAAASKSRYVMHETTPGVGDLSHYTGLGVWHGMRACLEFAGLRQARVAVQGVGSVGIALARILREQGMELLVADINPARAEQAAHELDAQIVAPEEILSSACDVLAPCALGGVVSAETVERIRARVVCGSANNILADDEAADTLAQRGVIYAPDYLVNAGALIRGVDYGVHKRPDSFASVARIYDRMRHVLQLARERGVSTARVADELAE